MTEHDMSAAVRTADQRVALDPATAPEVLAAIAAERPELRASVALNPTAYPGLLQWLADLGDPAVDAALAARASGATNVPPPPPAPPGPAEPVAVSAPTQPAPASGTAEQAPVQGRSVRAGRPRWVALAAGAVGVVVLGVVAWFAVSALQGGGGASSPEAAVQALADAIAHEDPAAAMAALAPDEVRVMAQLVGDVEKRAVELGFAKDGLTYAGIDLTVVGLDVSVDELSDDVARVEITGGAIGLEADADKAAPRTATLLRATGVKDGRLDLQDLSGEDENGRRTRPFVMVVRQGGGWYVSPLYTLGQAMSEARGLRSPAFDGEDWRPEPQDDPEQAVAAFIEAVGSMDPDDIAAAVPEHEAAPLLAYRRLVADAVSDAGFGRDGLAIEVEDLRTTTADLGRGLKAVTVTSADLTMSTPDGPASVRVDRGCVEIGLYDDYGDGPREWCAEDSFGGTAGRFVLVAAKTDGGWTVSPLNSIAQTLRSFVQAADFATILDNLDEEWLIAPTAEATVDGGGVDVVLGEAGFATVSVTGPAGPVLAAAEGAWVELYTEAGERLDAYGGLSLPEDGTYIAVVEGEPGGTTRLVVTGIAPIPLALDSPVSGRLGGDDLGAAYAVEVSDIGIGVELDGPGYWTAVSADHRDQFCSGDAADGLVVCPVSLPEVTIIVSAGADQGASQGEYTLVVRDVPRPSIDDAGTSLTGYVGSSSSTTHTVGPFAPGSMFALVLTSSSDVDLVLDVDNLTTGASSTVDESGSASSEYYTVYPESGELETLRVSVRPYYDDQPSSYRLELEPIGD